MVLQGIKKFILKRMQISALEQEVHRLKKETLALNIITYSDNKYLSEINFIKKHGITYFPYEKLKELGSIESGYDKKFRLPYVIHKGKRLYFPKSYSIEHCENMYRGYVERECLLGGGFSEKAPHQYQTESFKIEDNDVLIDVGCAEALLSLDVIEKVKKVILLEADSVWIKPLRATFNNYQDKVELICKYASDKDTKSTIKLETIFKNYIEKDSNTFVKMDIEGAEIDTLKGSFTFLKDKKNVKLACCTYHRDGDADSIRTLYEDLGFEYEFSDGYVLFLDDENLKYPYFRKGLLRGWK